MIRSTPDWARPRALAAQAALVVVVATLIAFAAYDGVVNMRARGIPLDFEFLDAPAGFAINQTLIEYSETSSNGRVFWVGLLNTGLVAIIGIALATPLGFLVGIARLSSNWPLARIAAAYVELMRNTPLLLQLLFWYNAVLKSLPQPRQSIDLFGLIKLNARGLYLPRPAANPGAAVFGGALLAAIVTCALFTLWAHRRRAVTGKSAPVGLVALFLILGAPALACLFAGAPLHFDIPTLSKFNLTGGLLVFPEFAALTFGLTLYSAGFIAEIVRAGVQAVSLGQREAAAALGLKRNLVMRLVVVPQALRLITPPLASQWLNIVKNSSLAVFVGYPDLVNVFAGTVLNQTQAAIQVMAMTMGAYLLISLTISMGLNAYGARRAGFAR